MPTNVQFKGSAQRLQKRKISEETCQHYKVYRDGELLRFPYYSSDKTLQGFKTKNKLKDFKYEGNTTDTLFGQSLIPSTGKRIMVYEGELDALSGWEAYPNWAHVSLPHGAASAKKDIQKQLQLFQGYEEIILFFDKDEAGKQGDGSRWLRSYRLGKLRLLIYQTRIRMLLTHCKIMMLKRSGKLSGMLRRISRME